MWEVGEDPKSNSTLVPTAEVKAAFALRLPHGVYSFSCENAKDLLFLEMNTKHSKTNSFSEKKKKRRGL